VINIWIDLADYDGNTVKILNWELGVWGKGVNRA